MKCKTGVTTKKFTQLLVFTLIFYIGSDLDALAFQQQEDNTITVTGSVTDNMGLPLPGVNVLEKSTTNGVMTDFDGNYSIDVAPQNAVLIFSYVGMQTLERAVEGETTINVALENDPQALDQVVLVGYGKQKKISVVGAQSTVKAEELELPVANLGTQLAGRVAGLTGVQRSGLPGFDGADLWIRGISTFGGSGPLVLVDGIERSLDNIDPRDIDSFTVLKDASATAVYGVRGANGVILIQTKRGEIGKPEISLDYFEGITYFTQVPELTSGIEYMNLANEARTTRGQVPLYSQDYIDRTASGEDPLLYPNVNWLDEVFRDFGRNRKALLNVSGGAERARYYVSMGYYDETGLFVTDGLENYDSDTRFKRYNFTSNLTLDITKTTQVNVGIQGYLSEGDYPSSGVDAIFGTALEANPVVYPKIYPGGYVPGRSVNGGLRNPYAEVALRGYRSLTRNKLNTNLDITQELGSIVKGLSFHGLFGFDTYNEQDINRGKRESTFFVDSNFPYNEDGSLLLNETFTGQNFLGYDRSNGGNKRTYLQASLNYDREFGKHNVSGLLLANRSDFSDNFAGNFTDAIPYRNQGLAGRATYSYDERYFMEVNAGYNGSEKFAPENRYGFFPSFAVGWVLSNEKFFEPISNTINYFKIRYSDGEVGSDSGAGRFAFLSRVEEGQPGYSYGENPGGIGGIQETFYGADVTWATSRKQDLGIEFNAFNNDLRVIVDFFKEHTTGAFLNRRDIPNYIGLNSDPSANIGVVNNKGFDGTINYNTTIGQEFRLGFRGTFSYNRNEIIQSGQPRQPHPWLNDKGYGLLANRGLVADGLFTLEDDINGDGFITTEDGFPTQYGQIQPGDIKYVDLNEDGQIDAFDRKVIGDGDVPALTYGAGITGQFKGFDLSMFFQGQEFADRYIGGYGVQPFTGDGGEGSTYAIVNDRWTPENNDPNATTPRLSYGQSAIGQGNNTQLSTYWLRDIAFFRLKSAELGYNLPETLTKYVGVNNFRVYLRATNVFTITDFDLWDPELNTSNGSRYPNISVIALGGTIQF
ncbi:SusC/RagA family TonB-linked outer membrane protein [Salegentibacter salinarum]|uniref:SusC/RagA family TonB-linked outer membrane protein n=1 Tax=Salegentibacter salinarum TaxID=447422 RepID=A0A2N0U0E1_9FLAO|nr:SusC/RagA family TonB-linked outer membrane protein [Salegentibacter salinarum]